MPDHARIVIDEERRTYASIPCAIRGETERDMIARRDALPLLSYHSDLLRCKIPQKLADFIAPEKPHDYAFDTTAGAVRARSKIEDGWRPDAKCRDGSGFQERLGLFGPFRSPTRWMADGHWWW